MICASIASTFDARTIGQRFDDAPHPGGLVPLAAMRHGREKRAVGLGQQAIVRHDGGGLADARRPSET